MHTRSSVCAFNHMPHMIKPKLVMYIHFLGQRYVCFSMTNQKYNKGSVGSVMSEQTHKINCLYIIQL